MIAVERRVQTVDVETFLTTLHVVIDEFAKIAAPPSPPSVGRQQQLSVGEALTVAMFEPQPLRRAPRRCSIDPRMPVLPFDRSGRAPAPSVRRPASAPAHWLV